MRIYCDMEFTGLRQNTELISIGIIADDGKIFYMEANDYELENLPGDSTNWLKENVIQYLMFNDVEDSFKMGGYRADLSLIKTYMQYFGKSNKKVIAKLLREWIKQYDEIIFIGDVPAYDWVLFAELLGRGEGAKGLPAHVSFKAIDLATCEYLLDTKANHIQTSKHLQGNEPWMQDHNALFDAILIKEQFNYITDIANKMKKLYKEKGDEK